MSNQTVLRRGTLAALVLLAPLACSDDGSPTGSGGAAGVTLSEATLSFAALGDSAQLTASVRDQAGNVISGATIAWSSTATNVVSVSASGWVKAVSNGTAEVVASTEGHADTATVEVEQVAATVTVTPESATLAEGETVQLTAVVADANDVVLETQPAVEWSSADEAVATVDDAGLATAVGWGAETEVTANAGTAGGTVTLSVLGQLLFVSQRDGNDEIYAMNADGSGQTNLTNAGGNDGEPVWSPDGSKVAFTSDRDGNDEIYVMNADGSGQENLTRTMGDESLPSWSPDGSRILFASDHSGKYEVYVMNADGSEQTSLTEDLNYAFRSAWSPDGAKVALEGRGEVINDEVYSVNADGSGMTNLTDRALSDCCPVWSPDGSKIAFTSFRDGNDEVYVMNAGGSDQTNLTRDESPDRLPAGRPRP